MGDLHVLRELPNPLQMTKSRKLMNRRRNGPGRVVANMSRVQGIVMRDLNYYTSISTDGSNNIVNTFPLDPTSFLETANMAHIFDEYRICAVTVQWFSLNPWKPQTGNLINVPLVIVFDNDDSSAIASYSEAFGHDGQKVVINMAAPGSSHAPFTRKFKRPSSGQDTSIAWYNLQSPTAAGAIKLAAFGASTATTVAGGIRLIFHTQFRGLINV